MTNTNKTAATEQDKANHETNPHALLKGDRVMLTKAVETRQGEGLPERLVMTVTGTRLVPVGVGADLAVRITCEDGLGRELHVFADDDLIAPYRVR